jgi:hypothetical protein
MGDLPADVRDLVIAECYARAADLSWDSLSQLQRSSAYDTWLDDLKIGQRLLSFLSREKARVWLKDVPMKEYGRAVAGIGPYARFAPYQMPSPESLVERLFGQEAVAQTASLRTKPNRIAFCDGEGERLMLWGAPKSLRDLVWAAMVAQVDSAANVVIVLCCTRAEHLTDADRKRHISLGEVAGIPVIHTDVKTHRVLPASGVTA